MSFSPKPRYGSDRRLGDDSLANDVFEKGIKMNTDFFSLAGEKFE